MANTFVNEVIEIKPYRHSAYWLVGASTHAIDRFIGDVERIFVPAKDHIGGTIEFDLSKDSLLVPGIKRTSRRIRYKNLMLKPPLIELGDRIIFDIRSNDYFNWSHQVNYFLTVALAARSLIDNARVTIVTPSQMPSMVKDLYALFGFDVVSTDGPVKARHLQWCVSHGQVVHSGRPQLTRAFMSEHDADSRTFPSFDLPTKVFLARRGTRSLSNHHEIEDLLTAMGFTTIYAEDLSVPQQFALFRQADEVVGIHGAGLAPLEFRSPSKSPIRLIELAPAGIVTRWFGIMCEQIGGKYVAVRGRLKPEYIQGLYSDELFEKYCNDNFEIDPKSLEVALDIVRSQ